MIPSADVIRQKMIGLLDVTHTETRALLSRLDPNRIVHTDERAWRVRDIIGHLGVWNWEAVRSLEAYAGGSEYYCIPTEAQYYDYNGPVAEERKGWTLEEVWKEYETSHDQLKRIVASLPDEKWAGEMLYPWNEKGKADSLIKIMMTHETVDHCGLVIRLLRL